MYNYIKTCVFVSGKSTQGWIWVLGLFACCIIILCRILRWRRWQSYSWRLLKMTQSLAAPSRIRYIHGRRIWSVTVWISSDLNVISHHCRYVCIRPLMLSLRPPTAMCVRCRKPWSLSTNAPTQPSEFLNLLLLWHFVFFTKFEIRAFYSCLLLFVTILGTVWFCFVFTNCRARKFTVVSAV